MNAAGKGPDGGGGRVEVRGADRAVAKHHEVAGGVGGKFVAGVLERATEELVVPLAVLGDDLADRVLRVFELRGGVEERTAAEAGLANLGGDVVADGPDEVAPLQLFGLLRGARSNVIVHTAQVGNGEIDLAGEVPVKVASVTWPSLMSRSIPTLLMPSA